MTLNGIGFSFIIFSRHIYKSIVPDYALSKCIENSGVVYSDEIFLNQNHTIIYT